jgi:hypothetical protein
MKMAMAWHEGCLRNLKLSVDGYQKRAAQAQADFERLAVQYSAYEKQIELAKAQGRDGFDPDRFGKGVK